MRFARTMPLAIVLLGAACSDDVSDPSTTATEDSGTSTSVDLSDACSFLGPAEFAVVGFTVTAEGEDVSENFTLSTTSSVACQWINDDDNISSSWELLIGTGDAEAAYEFELSFAEVNTLIPLRIGDESYLADKVSSFDSADHDYEAGVRIGDVLFTLSTTDDRGLGAIEALATLVADRLAP